MAGYGHRFPYREEGNPPLSRPTLDVRVQHGSTGDWNCRALVDTGAPITVFDRGVADALGMKIQYAGAEFGHVKLLGGSWKVQFEHVDLGLVDAPEITWSAQVAFVLSKELQMPFQGLLGTKGFLDKLAVAFNYYYGYFVLETPDDCEDRLG